MSEDRAPESPLEVTRYIGVVLRRKRALLDTLTDAEHEYYDAQREYEVAAAHAYFRHQGSIPAREREVTREPEIVELRRSAERKKVIVSDLKRRIAHCSDEIDGARTAAATLRAELSTLGLGADGA